MTYAPGHNCPGFVVCSMAVKEYTFGEGIKWIDLCDPSRQEMHVVNEQYEFNPHLLTDTMDPDHLPKYDEVENMHFLIVRYYCLLLDKPVTTIQELTSKIGIFYTNKFVITIHRHDPPFLKEIRERYIDRKRIKSTAEFVLKILWNVLETYDEPSQQLLEQLDFYERRIIMKETEPEHLESLYHIKRKASICQRILTLMAEPINHIRTKDRYELELEDVKDHHLKVSTVYTQVLDHVNNLMNLYLSFSAQKTNEVMKILTIFSVFFMPLTFIVGVYGMNFEFMPELRQRWGYPAVWAIMVVVVIIIYFWFKRKRWL